MGLTATTEADARLNNPWSNPKLTIGEACDLRIAGHRKSLERECIAKAKLEALQMLNHPYHELQTLMNGGSFPF